MSSSLPRSHGFYAIWRSKSREIEGGVERKALRRRQRAEQVGSDLSTSIVDLS
jgi:hypothetical protein